MLGFGQSPCIADWTENQGGQHRRLHHEKNAEGYRISNFRGLISQGPLKIIFSPTNDLQVNQPKHDQYTTALLLSFGNEQR